MKRTLPGACRLMCQAALLLSICATPALAALKQGDQAPEFTTQASLGGKVFDYSLAAALKKGPVVLYFYPAAFTTGCTIEAHEFADAVDQYRALGATVIGISHDNIETLKRFSVSECRGKFPVAADPAGAIIKSYDAKIPLLASMSKRISYVIAPDGTVIYEYADFAPDKHVANTLNALKVWTARHGAH